MTAPPHIVRVLVLEDEGLFRDMLQTALAAQPEIQVSARWRAAKRPSARPSAPHPDVVLADIELGPGLNGIEASVPIRARHHPRWRGLCSPRIGDKQYIASLRPGRRAAGRTCSSRQSPIRHARARHRGRRGGLVVLDPALVDALRPRPRSAVDALSERQRQVLALMAKGYSNSGIAQELVLTEKTVENYVGGIFQALASTAARPVHQRVKAVLAFLEGTQGT